jgi:hypothetical protein
MSSLSASAAEALISAAELFRVQETVLFVSGLLTKY